jgi:CRISPR-associated protein Csb2
LLRALVATWKRKLPVDPLVQRELPCVLAELARQSPQFHLPPATLGHTRHYMPWFKKGPDDKTLVFDAFVCLAPDAELVFHWPDATLSADGTHVLARLLDLLGYFGRAESWTSARLLANFDPARINCRIGYANAHSEPVRVLTADPQKCQAWDFTDRKIPRPDPLWNLLAETADTHLEKWSDPPGSKWITYARPSDCFAPNPAARHHPPANSSGITLARYALDASILPLVEETLPLAEQARRHLMGRYKRVRQERKYGRNIPPDAEKFVSEVFAGKDTEGRPLVGHQHAYYLPSDEDGDGRIDHVTVYAEKGFDADEIAALDRLRRLTCGAGEPLALLLVGLGQVRDFRAPLLAESAAWESATPFVATRYPKWSGRKRDPAALRGQEPMEFARLVLREEIERLRQRRGKLPNLERIDRLEGDRVGAHKLRRIQFKRSRSKRSDDGARHAWGAFRIVFDKPVRGPICLGHSCHFGLGLFLPAEPAAGRGK